MKTYTISDLHGYPVDKFKALLDKANFSDTDTLYILGDATATAAFRCFAISWHSRILDSFSAITRTCC